jgi:hypothetical protein
LQRIVEDGTHPLLSGKIQSISSRKRAAEGNFGFQNKDFLTEVNILRDIEIKKQIKEKTWILQDIEFHKKNVKQQINNGKHCSQIKKKCEYCNRIIDVANYNRSHGENCFLHTRIKRKFSNYKRATKTCEVCHKTMDSSNFKHYGHGPECQKIK